MTVAGMTGPPVPRDALLQRALAHHRAGDHDAAEAAYTAMLAADANDVDALHLLGVIATARGAPARGLALIEQALTLRDSPRFHCNRGIALGQLDRHQEALAAYQRALRDRPDYPEALNNLGTALERLGRPAEAAAAFRRALALRPDEPDWWGNLGNALRDLRQTEAAEAAYRRAVDLFLDGAQAQGRLGQALRADGRLAEAEAAFRAQLALTPDDPDARLNLAAALGDQDRPAEAAALLPAAVAAAPRRPELHHSHATALRQLGRFEEAEAACRQALSLRPDYADALGNLGEILRQRNHLKAAEASSRRALALTPTDVKAYNNLALVLVDQQRLEEALAVLDLAAGLQPADPDTRQHRAMVLLLLGRLTEGWADYEARFETRQGRGDRRDFPQPMWQGEALAGKTILLHAEQGIGDTLQFCRYVALVAERGARVVLEVPATLLRLLHPLPGLAALVGHGAALPDFDVHCPLLSLPGIFGTTLESIPAALPYLPVPAAAAPPRGVPRTRDGRRQIGIVWAGNPGHINDRRRSVPFAALAPLWQVPGIAWHSLQAGPRAADLADAPPEPIEDLGAGLTDWADTALAVCQLDLIICADTAVAHLAGALGRTVFLLLPRSPDWHWLTIGDTTPWYPGMRLFRQDHQCRWATVIDDVVAMLDVRAGVPIAPPSASGK
jgi:tetratricopeptide (TPR) repeat protein